MLLEVLKKEMLILKAKLVNLQILKGQKGVLH